MGRIHYSVCSCGAAIDEVFLGIGLSGDMATVAGLCSGCNTVQPISVLDDRARCNQCDGEVIPYWAPGMHDPELNQHIVVDEELRNSLRGTTKVFDYFQEAMRLEESLRAERGLRCPACGQLTMDLPGIGHWD